MTMNTGGNHSPGPVARPLHFPTPKVCRCETTTLSVLCNDHGRVQTMKQVLVPEAGSENNPSIAYAITKKLAKSTYGHVYLGAVLQRFSVEEGQHSSVEWESTGDYVSIKMSSFRNIHASRGKRLDDPIKEIAALQHLGAYHKNVLGCVEALQDDDHLYCISRYCSGGDLYRRLMGEGKKKSKTRRPDEQQVRVWFSQLLRGLSHLKRKGVCHRDIALENVVLDDADNLVICDLGLSLRVPYMQKRNEDSVCDISEGSRRRLMPNQGVCGNLTYLAPEVIRGSDIDGYAVDVWSAGVLLFVMLVGAAPFRWAHPSDLRFLQVAKGNLRKLVKEQDINISDSALDLLQSMMEKNPRKRPSITKILNHPWMREGRLFSAGPQMELLRNISNGSISRKRSFAAPPAPYESPAPLDYKGLVA